MHRVRGMHKAHALVQRSAAQHEHERQYGEPHQVEASAFALRGRATGVAATVNELRKRDALSAVQAERGRPAALLPTYDAGLSADLECEGGCHLNLRVLSSLRTEVYGRLDASTNDLCYG